MPEYLAPGVYVEETSFRHKTIEGVSTSTAGYVGPTRYGPTEGEPELLTSFADFERIYGGLDPLVFDGVSRTNFLAHAVRAFFEEGGSRLYVSRVEKGGAKASTNNQTIDSPPPSSITLRARFPGQAGNMRITFRPQLTDNLLVADPDSPDPKVLRIQEHDTVVVTEGSPAEHELYDVVREGEDLVLKRPGATASLALKLDKHRVRLLTVDVDIERPIIRPKRPKERYDPPETREGFSFHPKHANALTSYFADKPNTRMLALAVPFAIDLEASPLELDSGAEVAASLLGMNVINNLADDKVRRQQTYQLEKGSDGSLPDAGAYQGNGAGMAKSGLAAFEDLEDISIIAAPGVTLNYGKSDALATRAQTIQGYLISHCEKMRYRVAVLDSANEHTLADVREHRSKMDTTRAAFYYPWVTILDPITVEELDLPPSGFMAGIYARNDVENGVHKAPANEVVRLAIGFELPINKAQQDVLNPEGINCLRFFEGRGYRVWGARTISSDSEWKYINVRRYFVYLERSIERGTQWVVFENNTEHLWNDVRLTVEDFLYNEWRSGHLMGTKPEEAYFVRCDRSTMTQNDIDNGRLVCLIGVAPVKPAEFVIFRIGQWTADRRA